MSQEKIIRALQLVCESHDELRQNVEQIDHRVEKLEQITQAQAQEIVRLQQSVENFRDSAIRGEIASGKKTKDVAEAFRISPSRVSQIAPRSNFKH